MRPFPEKVYCEPFWNVKGQGQKWTTGGISIFHFTIPTIDRLGSHSQMRQIRQFSGLRRSLFLHFGVGPQKIWRKSQHRSLQLAATTTCEFTQRLWPVEWSWCPGHKSINSPDKFHSNKNWNPQQQKLNWCSWCTQILVFEWKKNPFMEREWKVMV